MQVQKILASGIALPVVALVGAGALVAPALQGRAFDMSSLGIAALLGAGGLVAALRERRAARRLRDCANQLDELLADMTRASQQEAIARQESNISVAWSVLKQFGEPFRVDGDRLFVGDHLLNDDTEIVDRIQAMVGGSATIFLNDLRIASNVRKADGSRAVGTRLDRSSPAHASVLGAGKPYRGIVDILGKSYFAGYDPIRDGQGRIIGALYVGVPRAGDIVMNESAAGTSGAGALTAHLRATITSIGMLNRANAGANSELDSERHAALVDRMKTDELRALAGQAQARVVANLSDALGRLSRGDLTVRIETAFADDYEELRRNFNNAVDSLARTIRTIESHIADVSMKAEELRDGAVELANRTSQQATSLDQTSTALESIANTVRHSAESAVDAALAANSVRADVTSSDQVLKQATTAMGEIETSALRISEIVSVIDEIALQTNLLALNAGVEAARAGDAGRGFAIVASEVRALAERSAHAAREIKGLIEISSGHVASGVELVEQSNTALGNIVGKIDTIVRLVDMISETTSGQARSLGQVSAEANAMDQITQDNAAMVEQSTASIRQLAAGAQELAGLIGQFNTGAQRPNARRGKTSLRAAS